VQRYIEAAEQVRLARDAMEAITPANLRTKRGAKLATPAAKLATLQHFCGLQGRVATPAGFEPATTGLEEVCYTQFGASKS
jgi:hypothetical protein